MGETARENRRAHRQDPSRKSLIRGIGGIARSADLHGSGSRPGCLIRKLPGTRERSDSLPRNAGIFQRAERNPAEIRQRRGLFARGSAASEITGSADPARLGPLQSIVGLAEPASRVSRRYRGLRDRL